MTAPRVLVVDDFEGFRTQAAALLRSAGFDVVATASTAAEAVDLAGLHRPDLVLLDVMLGDGHGFDAVPALRAVAGAVVLISTRDAGDYGRRIQECGADAFLAKSELSGPALRTLLTSA